MNELILYTTEDGRSQIRLRTENQTVWLTQLEMAELFDATKQNVSLHLKNLFEDGELGPGATVKESLTVQIEGDREVRCPVTLYNLDAILAVGYRVRSPRGVQFRRWASTILKEYLIKGFVIDDERLKNPDGRPDFRDYMLSFLFLRYLSDNYETAAKKELGKTRDPRPETPASGRCSCPTMPPAASTAWTAGACRSSSPPCRNPGRQSPWRWSWVAGRCGGGSDLSLAKDDSRFEGGGFPHSQPITL